MNECVTNATDVTQLLKIELDVFRLACKVWFAGNSTAAALLIRTTHLSAST